MEFINNHLGFAWDWQWIGKNPNLTREMINKHPDKYFNISWHSNLNKHPNKISDGCTYFQRHPGLTIDMIDNFPGEKRWDDFSRNSNITMTDIENNLHLP